MDRNQALHHQFMASVLQAAKDPSEAHLDVCRDLIKQGADVNATLPNGYSVVANIINSPVGQNGLSDQTQLRVVETLVKLGANPNEMNQYNQNLLMMCAATEKDLIAKSLVQWGANINQEDMDGVTPLTASIYRKNNEMIEYYLNDPRIELQQTDSRNNSPLHIAAQMGNSIAAYAIIERNRELLEMANEEGLSASALAKKNNHLELSAALEGMEMQRFTESVELVM